MCEMLFDHAEVVLGLPKVIGLLGDSYERYFSDLVTRSPALQNYWRRRRDWYVPDIQRLFDAVVARGPVGADIVKQVEPNVSAP